MSIQDQVARLSDQQALSIVASFTAEVVDKLETPAEKSVQASVLEEVLAGKGQMVDVAQLDHVSQAQAGAAARELLVLMADDELMAEASNDIRASLEELDEWLRDPPTQEAAAVPLLLAFPVVLTGCIVLLQLVGHTSFRRNADGSWEGEFDPAKEAPIDKVIQGIGKPLEHLTDGSLGQKP